MVKDILKLKWVKTGLKDWNKVVLDNVDQEAKDVEHKLQEVQNKMLTFGFSKCFFKAELATHDTLNSLLKNCWSLMGWLLRMLI